MHTQAGLILPPKHVIPAVVTREGMLSAAHDTAVKALHAAELANIVVGYNGAGKMTFFCDFDDLTAEGEVGECWKRLAEAGTDLWFSLLYAPFTFDGDPKVVKLSKTYAVAMLVGNAIGDDITGSLYLIRDDGLTRLPAKLAGFSKSNPQFNFDYNIKGH